MLFIVIILLVLVSIHDSLSISSNKAKVVAFWNIFAAGDIYHGIVNEQMAIIKQSGLYDKLDEIRYHTSGKEGSGLTLQDSKYHHIHNSDKSTESVTLRAVFDYCKTQSPDTKVLYFHNKGSFHVSETNLQFRHALDCFNLNPHCIDALDSFDTCGMRLAPLPHVHYPGNYWWAKCGHINKLLDPLSFQNNATIIDYTYYLWVGNDSIPLVRSASVEEARKRYGPFNRPGLGSGRYFAEAWLGSLPNFTAADCLSLELDKTYFNGYEKLPTTGIAGVCPNVKKYLANDTSTGFYKDDRFGAVCGPAGFLVAEPSLIKDMVEVQYRVVGAKFPKRLYDRSIYWYGQKPELVMNWLAKYKKIDKQYM